jgi:GcrA cell cycle regulator
MNWDDKALDELRRLWTLGLSTAEIGRRLGCTKNAVIGKAHRLDLPSRPSPIQATGPRDKPNVRARVAKRRERAAELAAKHIPTDQIATLLGVHIKTARDTLAEIGMARPPGRHTPKPEPARHTPGAARAHACRWPMWGDKERPTHRYCDGATVPGRPYCTAHCAKAFEKPTVAALSWARVAA